MGLEYGIWVTQRPTNLWFDAAEIALELIREPDELAPAGAAAFAFACPATDAGGVLRQPR